MEIASIGPVEANADLVRKRFAEAASRIAGKKLGILYLPAKADHVALLRAAEEGLGYPVVGASTGGAAFTERGHTRDGIVGGVLGGTAFDYAISVARDLGAPDPVGLRRACDEVVDAARRHPGKSPALMTLADGLAMDGGEVLDTLLAHTPPHWRLFGGAAGDDLQFARTVVFAGGEVLRGAAVLVALFTEASAGVAVEHGWSAVEGGREMVVTEVNRTHIITLDGKPAEAVYRGELERLGLVSADDRELRKTVRYELGAKTVHGELKIRGALGMPGDGSVRLAAGVSTGTVLRVVAASAEQLIAAARSVAQRSLEPLSTGPVHGALVFDCAARLAHLGPRYGEQTAAFSGGRSFPLVGTTVYGEIAKFGGSLEGFHNATVVMAAW